MEKIRAQVARIQAEIDEAENALRTGEPFEMQGRLDQLQDWSAELREIDRMFEEAK